jgi:hypothetical protein
MIIYSIRASLKTSIFPRTALSHFDFAQCDRLYQAERLWQAERSAKVRSPYGMRFLEILITT